ncbi:MAG: hypothetical protein AAGI11_23270 [Pseudomonadota bacterium]
MRRLIALMFSIVCLSAAHADEDGVWRGDCDDKGCILYECDDEGICIEVDQLTYGEMIERLSITDITDFTANPDADRGYNGPDQPRGISASGALSALTGQGGENETAKAVFWVCGAHSTCCAGGAGGCEQFTAACYGSDDHVGSYDENSGVGSCTSTRDDEE